MSSSADDLASALDRTRRSYDDTPYDSKPLIRCHPGRMAAQAIWRGLAAPDAARARVLEIGCASGGHLIPLAAALPEARFLGLDLSAVQITVGEARRRRLGLENLELRDASFETLGEPDGLFDFIVCHGVYSWIPEPLRDPLLRTIQARLAPQGVAMVSYNVLPGWRVFQIARDAMLLNARLVDPAERAEKSRELFGLLAQGSETRHTYGKFWRDEAKELLEGGDAYLAHEVFEETNAPVAFADFADRAAAAGLDYLGETLVGASLPEERAPDGAEHIWRLSGSDRMKREIYIDIFSGRTFRESLLVHRGRASGLAEETADRALEALHFIPALELQFATAPNEPGTFRISLKETQLDLRHSQAEPAIRRLFERRPASSRLADLLQGEPESACAEVRDLLRVAVNTGLVAISSLPVTCAARPPERPKLWPLAAADAQQGSMTTTLRHSTFRLAPLQSFLAPLLDGRHSRADLVEAAVALAAQGELTLSGPDGPVSDASEIRRRLESGVDRALAGLLDAGLLLEG